MNASIISAKDLAASLDVWTLIDARTAEEFAAGHIPGAIHLCWEQWCDRPPEIAGPELAQPGYWGVLADPVINAFHKRLEELGISSSARIVVYADGPRSKGSDGRIGWMLLYLGAEHVALLDGGWQGWLQISGTVDFDVVTRRGAFNLSLNPERRIDFDDIKNRFTHTRLPLMIDTRSFPEFAGVDYDYQPRKGRMPNSVLLEWLQIFDHEEKYVECDVFLRLLPEAVHTSSDAIFYCEIGVRA